ncbi:hypothetical protein [Natronogracilivirga saccharolytica]|uniref:DUF3618 domain-containing protein n=1 Tax=Natronogracilivirga saccharolytica TaxID=2812953 RepID=A0A8J7RIG2_9BACT|nr:hypothetical protein [Natronogracilivirga saccharolytica]MBP3191220.1 hypothetical protein [Natronogracilivirga saccharolytica]
MEQKRTKSSDIKELRARKQALRREMAEIQTEIESSLTEVRRSFFGRVHYRYWIEKYPLQLLGSAVVAGFLVARKTGMRHTDDFSDAEDSSEKKAPSSLGLFSGLLADELKKLAAQRTVRYIMKRIEEAVDNRNEEEIHTDK